MTDINDRRALVESLQKAIDSVPESPAIDGGRGAECGSSPSASAASVAAGDSGRESCPGSGDDPDVAAIRDASKRAYAILALRDHSRVELRQKLVERGHEERIVDVLLIKLEDAGLIDDARFAEQFVRSHRLGRGKSLSAIARALRDKGVDDDIARDALDEGGDDFPFALDAARKKAASTLGLEHEVRLRRVLGVLGRRGFGGSVAFRAAQQALDEDEDGVV